MRTYAIDQTKPKLIRRTLQALLYAALYFVIMLCWEFFWPSGTEKHGGISGIATKAALMAVIWGTVMSFYFGPSKRSLIVDDESITGINQAARLVELGLNKRIVRKGKIKTIREYTNRSGSPKGTLLSERSIIGARMMGWVYIPASLPEYEDLKRLAESWRLPEKPVE